MICQNNLAICGYSLFIGWRLKDGTLLIKKDQTSNIVLHLHSRAAAASLKWCENWIA
jgi:hypothetical protein